MALTLEWNNNYSVNIGEIDNQHKKLIGMINALMVAMSDGKSNDILGNLISDLAEYARTHFGTEEKYFDQFGYPETVSHKEEHSEFIKKVAEFKAGFDAGKLGLSIDVLVFLSDWLENHLNRVDKKYVPFFTEKGLK
jgi:hemerythrin